MYTEEWYQLGRITKTHGVNGEVVIRTDKEFSEFVSKRESVFIEINKELIPFFILDSFIMQSDTVVLAFEDVNNPEQAKQILQTNIYIPKIELPKSTNEILVTDDVLNFLVIDQTNGEIGVVVDIINTTHQGLLVVKNNQHEVLIPIDDAIILDIMYHDKQILVDLPDGLIELND